MEFKRPETLIATGKSGKRIWKELGRSGIDGIFINSINGLYFW